MKTLYCFSIFLLFFLFPKEVLAQVKINEILPNPAAGENEWVELYNSGNEVVNLSGWKLNDEANHLKDISFLGIIGGGQFAVYEYSGDGWLNNSTGDTVYLIDATEVAVDSYYYGSDPGEGKSFGRYPNGGENWFVYDSPSKGNSNPDPAPPELSPTPTSSPTPTPFLPPTATPTPTPSPVAYYKINAVKNQQGETISAVKIYVDQVYIGHYPPETLKFCDGCQCDTVVACGFGNHTIKLEKKDYLPWSEQKNFNAGDSYEVNPILQPSSLSTPTPASTPTATPAPRVSPSPGEILGEVQEETTSVFYPLEISTPSSSPMVEGASSRKIGPTLLLIAGLGLLFLSAFWLWYTRIR